MVKSGLCLRVIILAERRRHQAADKKMPVLTIAAEADTQITLIVCERCQEPRICVFQRFDASMVTYKILASIALYRTPFLVREIWYSVYGNHHPLLKKLIERAFMRVRLCV